MIFLKNKILIHSHSLLFTGGVCFCLLVYFRFDRFVGRAELGLRANWEGEGLRGRERAPPSSYRTRKGSWAGLVRNAFGQITFLFWVSVQALALTV